MSDFIIQSTEFNKQWNYRTSFLNKQWKNNWINLSMYMYLIKFEQYQLQCITLKIRSKADFKSKSQNIWQQIILFSSTVMQMICVWHKIWTLSGRLSLIIFVFHITLSKFNVYINLAAQYKIELWWCISISYTIHLYYYFKIYFAIMNINIYTKSRTFMHI
jgi:hypothetical protein